MGNDKQRSNMDTALLDSNPILDNIAPTLYSPLRLICTVSLAPQSRQLHVQLLITVVEQFPLPPVRLLVPHSIHHVPQPPFAFCANCTQTPWMPVALEFSSNFCMQNIFGVLSNQHTVCRYTKLKTKKKKFPFAKNTTGCRRQEPLFRLQRLP